MVQATLTKALEAQGIGFLSVTSRAKTLESLAEKLQRKSYRDPRSEVHDLAGVRVITYIEAESQKVAKLVNDTFAVHLDKSLDKGQELGVDRLGYRSTHFVCELGDRRCDLPEFAPFKGLLFEIQIRTVLQHAWAEIEHDRNYKFAGVLPTELHRRLNLAAGTLEMVDREFDALGREIDQYAARVATQAKAGDLGAPLNSTSLHAFLRSRRLREIRFRPGMSFRRRGDSEILDELKRFGVNTLEGVDALLSPEFLAAFPGDHSLSVVGLLRTAMQFEDVTRYLEKAWQRSWKWIPRDAFAAIARKYGEEELRRVYRAHGVEVESVDDSASETAPDGSEGTP